MGKFKLLLSACVFICLASAEKYHETIHTGKGIPVPHAEFIERLMKKNMFPNKTADQSFLDLYGDVSDLDNATLSRLQNLEFSVLDVDNVKLYAKLARRCNERSQAALGQTGGRRLQFNSFDRYDGHIMKTFLRLMQKSIFNTRLILQRTNSIRARYRSDVSYNIGLLYGTLMELKTKAARALTTISQLLPDIEIKVMWYLLLYERVLQIHTDATTTVQRIFELHRGGATTAIKENPAEEAYKAQQRKQRKKTTNVKTS